MTLVFECFDTVRFQVQEMARAEKIISDEGDPGRARHLQPAAAGPGGALGHRLHRADLGRWRSGSGCPGWSGSSAGSACQSTVTWWRACPRPSTRRPSPARRSRRRSTTSASGSPRPRWRPSPRPREVALVATHPAYEARTELSPAVRQRAARRPARHNKGPSDRLTRDNSVRKSLQAHRTCAILFVRRIWGCRRRSIDQKGLRTGRIKYPPFHPLLRKCFP